MRERRQPARIFLVVAALALGGCQASSLDRLKQVLLEGPPASVETSAPQRAAGKAAPDKSRRETAEMARKEAEAAERARREATEMARFGDSPAARIVAFADTCFSGRANADKLVFGGVAPVILTAKMRGFDSDKVTLFLAGGADQFANQYEEKGHRLFSYYLMRGLAEGLLEPALLNAYVAERVSRYSRRLGITYTQEPLLVGNKNKRL